MREREGKREDNRRMRMLSCLALFSRKKMKTFLGGKRTDDFFFFQFSLSDPQKCQTHFKVRTTYKLGAATIGMTTSNIMTLRVMPLNITILSIATLSVTAINIMTFNI